MMADQCDAFQQCIQPQSTPEWFTIMVIVLSAVVVILLALCAVTWVRDRKRRVVSEATVESVKRKSPDRVA
jgi:threonine/homoserine/homoserine lactone efflux protein